MSPQVTEQLSPQPFRQWCAWRLDPVGWDKPDAPEVEEAGIAQLAFELGLGARRFWRWRNETKTLERIEVEEALHQAGVRFWDVYPAEKSLPVRTPLPQNQPFYNAVLSEDQLLELHRLHKLGIPVKVLAERTWKAAGFASSVSAEKRIRVGFGYLGLPTTRGLRHLPPDRQCLELRKDGERCEQAALKDSDRCFHHDRSTREKARETHRRSVKTRWGTRTEEMVA